MKCSRTWAVGENRHWTCSMPAPRYQRLTRLPIEPQRHREEKSIGLLCVSVSLWFNLSTEIHATWIRSLRITSSWTASPWGGRSSRPVPRASRSRARLGRGHRAVGPGRPTADFRNRATRASPPSAAGRRPVSSRFGGRGGTASRRRRRGAGPRNLARPAPAIPCPAPSASDARGPGPAPGRDGRPLPRAQDHVEHAGPVALLERQSRRER